MLPTTPSEMPPEKHPVKPANKHFSLVFAHPDFESDLLVEAERRGVQLTEIARHLYRFSSGENAQHNFCWARDEWHGCEQMEIESVGKIATKLREISKRPWRQVTTAAHRRGELIEASFTTPAKAARRREPKTFWPKTSARERTLPAFTLLSPTELICCASPREEVDAGIWNFVEDRVNPPSRAYLKLWEWGWRTHHLPSAGETAVDLGASPGGWTWVLVKAGLRVFAYDRSPLDLKLNREEQSRVHFTKGDAFAVEPRTFVSSPHNPTIDWVFCDVIAEPRRTLELLKAWLPSRAGLVFTIKFKGSTDFDTIDELRQVPDSMIQHLDVNKHEVTFWRQPLFRTESSSAEVSRDGTDLPS